MKILLTIIGVLAFIAVICVVVSIAKGIVRFLIKAFIVVYGGAMIIAGGSTVPKYIMNKFSSVKEVAKEATTKAKKETKKKVKAKKVKAKKIKVEKGEDSMFFACFMKSKGLMLSGIVVSVVLLLFRIKCHLIIPIWGICLPTLLCLLYTAAQVGILFLAYKLDCKWLKRWLK